MKKPRNKKAKTIKSGKNWLKEHRAIIIISVVIIMLLVTFGTKVFLYLNFILGNDIIIHLDADKEDLILVRGEEESVNFKAGVITNPFCTAECESSFEDISNNKTIDYNKFKLTPGIPITKKYKIIVGDFGEGQKLYRFRLKCVGLTSFLCHTKGESTSRNILVTVEYKLTENERKLKDDLKNKLINLKERLSDLATKANEVDLVINELDKHVSIDETKKEFNNTEISKLIEDLNSLKKIWDEQDYYSLNNSLQETNTKSIRIEKIIKIIDKNMSSSVFSYNNLANEVNEIRETLKEIKNVLVLDENLTLEINNNIKVFNSVIKSFNSRNEISKKRIEVYSINYSVDKLHESIESYERKETLKRNIEVDINYDILCMLNQTCVKRPSISERANQTEFELKNTCDEIDELKVLYTNISKSNNNSYANESIDAIKKDIAEKYLNELPKDGYNNEIIKEILLAYVTNSTAEVYDINSTEILKQLIKEQPESCQKLNISYYGLNNESIELIKEEETMPVKIGIEFDEPSLKCCVFGKCSPCCLSEECINDPSKFPIVFVHGHSVNKKTSADYSLDVFNKLQNELEKDGYLNAGSISLYTPVDTSPGVWGLSQAPVSIKASYYFDVFKEPENYVVVQTKSENIDTYALRLREIIQTIKHRTGKPKVILIAHSMGGLVSRRYLQIFGEDDVEKLIMIGTPNHGIEGDIAHICPIIGDKYACRDMTVNSLFMNKLNRGKLPNIKIYMIIGDGCLMDGQPGDGTVLVKNAKLEGKMVKNFIINGTCDGLKMLHSKMLDPQLHPEVYKIIKGALKKE